MYDYKKDNGQLSSENEVGTFSDGGNISSDFKLQKESLPQWAVDWARNRFNMDAQNVKFYVMDRQEVDDSVALASGNNVFVTSDQRNDETVIKHELTHIYQQAIGTATESNVCDTSLEDEAIQISKDSEFSLAKNQTKSDRYILPRERTNIVQPLVTEILAGIAIAGAVTWGAVSIVRAVKKSKICNRAYKNLERKVDLKLIKKIYDEFYFARDQFNKPSNTESLTCFERLCKFANEDRSKILESRDKLYDLFEGGVVTYLSNPYKENYFQQYVDGLDKGLGRLTPDLNRALYTELGIPDTVAIAEERNKSVDDIVCDLNIEWGRKRLNEETEKRLSSMWSLYTSTGGFKARKFDNGQEQRDFLVERGSDLFINNVGSEGERTLYRYTSGSYQIMMYDLSILFGKSFKEMSSTEIDEYRALCAKGLITLNPEKLSKTYYTLFDMRGTKDSSKKKRIFRHLALNTSCFTDKAKMNAFYDMRTKLSERLGITGGKKEYIYLTESLAEHFEFMKDYRWRTIVIYANFVINQDEELKKCKKASDWTKEKIEKLLNDTRVKAEWYKDITFE